MEFSLDEGLSWQRLEQYFETPGMIYTALVPLDVGNPLQDRQVFSGQSRGYTFTRINVGFAEGRNARFRFRIGTDYQVGDIGWFIDDFQIYQCLDRPPASISDATVTEGDVGTTPAVFTVSLPKPFPLPLSFDYSTYTPVALSSDAQHRLRPRSGKASFSSGVTSRTISVPVLGDLEGEGEEPFYVQITEGGNGARGAEGAGTIVDDDSLGVGVSDVTVAEPRSGTVTAAFAVTNTWNPNPITVSFHTSDGTATAPLDYTPVSGTLTFAAEETRRTVDVSVGVNPSGINERKFFLDLSNSSSPDSPVTRPRGTATIYKPGLYPLTPCRLLDTREREQGPALSAGATRTVVVGDRCGIPQTATAVSLNVTVVYPTGPGDLRMFSSGPAPLVSTINYSPGRSGRTMPSSP